MECPTCDEEFDSRIAMLSHHSQIHNKNLATISKECKTCGEKFQTSLSNSDKKYCSRNCWKKISRTVISCKNCSKKFEVKKSMSKQIQFCNSDCKTDFYYTTIKCDNCGKPIKRRKKEVKKKNFCNSKCHLTYKKEKGNVERNCSYCGKNITVHKSLAERYELSFCNNNCQGKWYSKNKSGVDNPLHGIDRPKHSKLMKGSNNPSKRPEVRKKLGLSEENNPMWKGGVAKKYPTEFHMIADYIRKRDDRTCQMCGITREEYSKDRKMDVHHINGDKKDNKPENLVTVCNPCNVQIEHMDKRPQFNHINFSIEESNIK